MQENRSFAEIRQRLREIEDKSIASRLQEEEFNKYYNHNREYRRVVGDDTKHSIREQANEDEFARRRRVETIQKIAESDEEIARHLQQKLEEEERERLEQQIRMDAELAKALVDDDFVNTNSYSRVILPLQLHHHSPPTFSTFGYPSDNDESSGGPSLSVTSCYNTFGVNANPHPIEHLFQPQTNSSWKNERLSHLHSAHREWLNNDEYPQADPNTFTSSSSQQMPLPSTSTMGTLWSEPTLVASLHPTNPFLEDFIIRDPVSRALEPSQTHLSEFGLPPPSDLALGKRR